MKILLSNKFYYRRGGDCIYTLNLEQLLRQHGHKVALFAMQHPENMPSEWEKYFPSEVNFSAGSGSIETIRRPLGTKEVIKKFNALLSDFQPDVVHLNNIHSQLSPVIAQIAHKRGIKTVWTIHDLKMLCPRYDCLRGGKEICELCFTDKKQVLKNRCMKNSLFASLLAYWETMKWTGEKLENNTDVFICPSRFMANKMIQGGFNKNKMVTLCNFIDVEKTRRSDYDKEDYYCFVGRLSHEKGVKTLIEAARQLPFHLKIVGGGPLSEELQQSVKEDHIEFVGHRQWDEIKEIVGKARFMVIPSECYENNPLSVIEAQCLGTPVLGANIGGIPELIKDGKTGMLFESRNIEDLKNKIEQMFSMNFDDAEIAKESQNRYSAEKYHQEIINIYSTKQEQHLKILLANKFYYRRGGDCTYTLNQEQLLRQRDHRVAVFAMQYPENNPSEWEKYFPSEVKFDARLGDVETIRRPLGTKEVKRKFTDLLNDFQPDVVHLNNIHSQISPVIAQMAHERGIKTVWTLHDYKLLCPRYDCLRGGKEICELCFTDKKQAFKNRCVKNSRLASLIAYWEAMKWTKEKLEKYTDVFICPSQFMASKMIQGGFDRNKMVILPYFFINPEETKRNYCDKENYYCYIGRLSNEKGIETLIDAAQQLPFHLKIVGEGPLSEKLQQSVKKDHIEFTGYHTWSEIKEIVGKARFMVIPSEWYENYPLSVIEALCLGTPVLGANIGGIPEMINDHNGALFESRNIEDLKAKIEQMFSVNFEYAQIAQISQNNFSEEKYYQEIIKIYH